MNLAGQGAIHIFALVALWRGPTVPLVMLALVSYVVRMFAITAGYHRYFSHRSYKTSRAMQFFLALLGTTATQRGPLWWASTHRLHHKHSDTELDPHSARTKGFFHAHMGWWIVGEHEDIDYSQVRDLTRYPELVFIDKWHWIGVLLIIGGLSAVSFDALLWGYAVSTTLLSHGTFCINSLAHVWGKRRFATTDDSRNNGLLALVTMGEGWHNNHHHYQSSCRQGFYWWEIDLSYYILRVMASLGLVWELREPPPRVLAEGRG